MEKTMTDEREELEGNDTYPWDKTIIAHGMDGMKLIGWVDSGDHDLTDYLNERVTSGTPVCMNNARGIIAQIQNQPTPDGQMSIGKLVLVMGVDAFEAGIGKLWTQITRWYYPKEDDHCLKVMKDLLRNRKEMELKSRAARSNIEIPGLRPPTDITGRLNVPGRRGGLH
jgi:hypothetical protein